MFPVGGRLKPGGSRPGATVPWAAGRRARAAEPAAPAAAPAGAVRSIPSWPAPPAPPSARSPKRGPTTPQAAGRDLKPQGAGRSHAEPPRPRLLGDRESGGQGTGKGPQSPHPADLHYARHSGLRWEIGRKPDGTEGLSTDTPVQTLRDRPCYCDPQMASNDRACSLF